MTGKKKPLNYPETYQLRVSKKLKEKLIKKDSREIRKILNNL